MVIQKATNRITTIIISAHFGIKLKRTRHDVNCKGINICEESEDFYPQHKDSIYTKLRSVNHHGALLSFCGLLQTNQNLCPKCVLDSQMSKFALI